MRHCIKTVENESKANHPSREKGVTAKYLQLVDTLISIP